MSTIMPAIKYYSSTSYYFYEEICVDYYVHTRCEIYIPLFPHLIIKVTNWKTRGILIPEIFSMQGRIGQGMHTRGRTRI